MIEVIAIIALLGLAFNVVFYTNTSSERAKGKTPKQVVVKIMEANDILKGML